MPLPNMIFNINHLSLKFLLTPTNILVGVNNYMNLANRLPASFSFSILVWQYPINVDTCE
ncbi:hypothetical protein SPTER_44190 [Sporomusa termitida]|uniref:Uncharacterized protein n=1 Tax=Sporomusa termitida TaxID=2377 RepID=A0A517E0E4_9FIRM|nr:hypothetical protein SPTER_44190 [Sporomusa termitida]